MHLKIILMIIAISITQKLISIAEISFFIVKWNEMWKRKKEWSVPDDEKEKKSEVSPTKRGRKELMKFLYFTDSHIRGVNPRGRKDNFCETVLKKIEEIIDVSKEYNVDYILNGGDWFDRPDLAPSIVREFAKTIKNFNKPVYTIAGNHDIFGQNPDTISRTMLGLVESTGLVKIIKDDEKIILDDGKNKVLLVGKSFKYDIDGEGREVAYVIKKNDDVDYIINIVHGMLLEKPFFKGIPYTLIDDIAHTDADITLAGHYHNGFGIIKKGEKYFINPGSIVRISSSIIDMQRKPNIVIIELSNGIEVKEIFLKTALPGDEVLNRDHIERTREYQMKINDFYFELSNTKNFNKINLDAIINDIIINEEIDESVKNEAIKRINSARERLSSGDEDLWYG